MSITVQRSPLTMVVIPKCCNSGCSPVFIRYLAFTSISRTPHVRPKAGLAYHDEQCSYTTSYHGTANRPSYLHSPFQSALPSHKSRTPQKISTSPPSPRPCNPLLVTHQVAPPRPINPPKYFPTLPYPPPPPPSSLSHPIPSVPSPPPPPPRHLPHPIPFHHPTTHTPSAAGGP